jgi:mercuric ion transport protein
MSIRVELIYDLHCPNVPEARKSLLEAFAQAGLTPAWTEWERGSPDGPAYVARYGSPTILVDGGDVAGVELAGNGDCCRLYQHGSEGARGAPPVASIVRALRSAGAAGAADQNGHAFGWRRLLPTLPGVGAALLPVGGCPACWPVYSAVLAALGLGFLLKSAYLVWIEGALVGLALLALGFRARARRGYGPLVLGAVSAGIVLFFKFGRAFPPLVYAGLAGLVIACVWNAWPIGSGGRDACPQCLRAEAQNAPQTDPEGGKRYGNEAKG